MSMMNKRAILIILLFLLTPLLAEDKQDVKPVSKDEILNELKNAPKTNPDREKKLATLYQQAGAKKEEVKLQKFTGGGTDMNNVIVVKKGETDKTIIIGGHLDKVDKGNGIIDDWSGASMATNVYQTFRTVKTKHTLIFIGFAGEEIGLLGSKHYVSQMTTDDRKNCTAMVNLEVLGVGGPFIWTNGSTDSLEAKLHSVAKDEKLELKDHVINGVGADSQPFEKVGIQNITIDGLPDDKLSYIHSENDKFENINKDTYYNTYKLVIAFVKRLDKEE